MGEGTRDGREETATGTGTGQGGGNEDGYRNENEGRHEGEKGSENGRGNRTENGDEIMEIEVEERESLGTYEVVINVGRKTRGVRRSQGVTGNHSRNPTPERDCRIMLRTIAQGWRQGTEVGRADERPRSTNKAEEL